MDYRRAALTLLSAALALPVAARETSAQSLDYKVTVDDPTNALGIDRAAVLANLGAAIADWGRFIDGRGRLWIDVQITTDTHDGRFTGGWKDENEVRLKSASGLTIDEAPATYKLRTGKAAVPGEPDVLIQIQPDFMRKNYWIDPRPLLRADPVPAGKVDLVTVFAHELGHGLGIDGHLDLKTAALPKDRKITTFDSLISTGDPKNLAFIGTATERVYGGPLPLSLFPSTDAVFLHYGGKAFVSSRYASQNIYHYGRFSEGRPESDLSFFGLMAGVWLDRDTASGLRIRVGALDAAILSDLGVPIKSGVDSSR